MNQKEELLRLKKQIKQTEALLCEAAPQTEIDDYLVALKITLEKQLNALVSSAKLAK